MSPFNIQKILEGLVINFSAIHVDYVKNVQVSFAEKVENYNLQDFLSMINNEDDDMKYLIQSVDVDLNVDLIEKTIKSTLKTMNSNIKKLLKLPITEF